MIAVDWSWVQLIVAGVVLAAGGLGLWLIREHGPRDPYPWEPEGEGD